MYILFLIGKNTVGKVRSFKVRSISKFESFNFFQVPAAQPIKGDITGGSEVTETADSAVSVDSAVPG